MRLIQAKVRCVEGVQDTGWFVPGRETTVVVGPRGSGKTALFKALQTLNPPYDIDQVKPLANHPLVWHQDAYARKVIPSKKTAVYQVFSARPEQVVALADIDADLMETDRIEIGRRLDNSRWTSFVEIPASSRWREIREDMKVLHLQVADLEDGADSAFFQGLYESDRLQGDTAMRCRHWLKGIEALLGADQHQRYQRCLYHIQRRQRFFKAEESIAQELPLTLYLDPDCALPSSLLVDEIKKGRMRDVAPVVDLLSLLFRKSDEPLTGETFGQLQKDAEKGMEPLLQMLAENGWPIPGLSFAGQRIFFANIPPTTFSRRLYVIGLTCYLAQLCHGEKPVLLLDCFDRGLAGDELSEITRFQQYLGGWCQLLVATADEGVAGGPGWQSMFRIGPGGLGSSELLSF